MHWKRSVLAFRSFLSLGLLLAVPTSFVAQQNAQPLDQTLDAILLRLQNNLAHYKSAIPNLFCDEHVVSSMHLDGFDLSKTTTDSIFRLKHSTDKALLTEFNESREVEKVNGKPPHSDSLKGPIILAGAFSNALEVVSLDFKRCYDYHLIPDQRFHHVPALAIDYSLKDNAVEDKACPGPEKNSGRAFIDPQTMQVIHLEMKIPRHETKDGLFEIWTWSIDYAPVVFDNQSFWMPTTVNSKLVETAQRTDWEFVATYSNYHELNVTSKVLPGFTPVPNQ